MNKRKRKEDTKRKREKKNDGKQIKQMGFVKF